MLQTLVAIASIVVLTGAILTSALVSAKNAFHQAVVAKTQTAMTDATSQFTQWAASIIATSGTEQNWAGATNPNVVTKSMCVTTGPCQFYETTTWTVTGATVGKQLQQTSAQSISTASNMAPAVDEQRLSVTINSAVSDASGHNIYGGRSEELTARLFDAKPYVVITGAHDTSSEVSLQTASEGDSGGSMPSGFGYGVVSEPDIQQPGSYTNTVIKTIVDCQNSIPFDETDPTSTTDKANKLIIKVRQGGSLSWSFQMPCVPTYGVPAAPSGTQNYAAPNGAVYNIQSSNGSQSWLKGDQVRGFPR